jgi:biotin carboxylase
MAPEFVAQQVQKITLDFSKLISQINYLGFFGLDFLVDQNNQVYLLECNPRLTASFAFYTKLELSQNLFPLFLLHLAQFVDLPNIPTTNQIQTELNSTLISGSEITRKVNSKTIGKLQKLIPLSQQVDPIIIPQNIIDQLYV